ncbi:endopeptidase La [Allobaculum mucilyticum]|uniref:endopeptidase La n=1 Tax=Allobaculum mucilyticum TaxID=2834459 RepID=UPI001E5247BA|nr:endopeptidase La [Allobaculum mucilyticum]UNT97244.1 endopeptidase La [Allobaculum mucilyticum]
MNYDVTESPFLRVAGTLLLPDTILRLKNLPREHADTLVSTRFVAWSGEDELAEPGNENLNLYGLLCETQGLSEDEGETALTVKAIERVRITSLYKNGITCTWVPAPETQDLDEKAQEQMLKYIKDLVTELASSVQGGRHIARRACQYSTLNQLMAFLAQYVDISQQECYELIATDSLHERSVHFIDYLLRQKESLSLNMEMREKLSKEASDYYRRQALIRQMEAIKSELDDGEEPSEKKNDYAARIKEAGMNEEVEKALLEDAKRLEETNPQSSDAEVLKNYLEFALSLPWKKEPAFDPDLAEARAILDARHAGMDKVKERIIQHLAIMKLRASNKGSAILLVGPPGTGKTSLGKSIARALHRPYTRLSLGGIRDESEIRGHRRTYVGAMSGRVLKAMKTAGATNPVMILDELDKMMAGGFSGDPAAAMLEVLDPEQNDTFTDHYLDLPYDLSDVMFIATANSLDTIPAPLLDRMEIISLSSYTPSEKFTIATRHLLPEVLEEHGIQPGQLTLEADAIREIINSYTMEAGCRGLKKQLAKVCRFKAVELIEKGGPICVKADDLKDIFGPIAIRHDKVKDHNPVGVITGMAWTAAGGEVLMIEAASMPGKGQMILTGQLGDVMKESARISYSVLKSRLPLDTMEFEKQDIHIHFPAGATPKDGPSAGITIFTALASLALEKPVDSHIAMTGELSLSGEVLPIGGLKEKLFGAMRAGITKVLIPIDNVRDLEEVDEEVKNALNIIPVSTVEEVLKETLGVHFTDNTMPRLAAKGAEVLF